MSPDIMRWCYNFQRFRIISRKDTHSGRWLDISATASNTGTNHYYWTIFFFSILFGKNYLSGDLYDPKCVWNVLGFFTCWSLHLLFFYPKAIKMFDVEIYKDSAVQYYLVNNRNSFWNSHSFILGNEELLLDLNDLLTQKWIFIY